MISLQLSQSPRFKLVPDKIGILNSKKFTSFTYLNRYVDEEKSQLALHLRYSFEGDGSPPIILEQVEHVVNHPDPVQLQAGVEVRDPARPHAPTLRRHGSKLPSPVADPGDEGVVVQGEEVRVTYLDGEADGYVQA